MRLTFQGIVGEISSLPGCSQEELAELERLLANATPGEWSCLNKVGVVFGPDCQVAHCGDFGDKELVPFNADRWQSDAALIVALRNAAPSLIATAREAEALRAENARLREALVAEREENLWSAYATGDVRGDEWTHLYMSDGEWLVRQCGLDPKQGYYKAAEIRDAIPVAARAALEQEEAAILRAERNEP